MQSSEKMRFYVASGDFIAEVQPDFLTQRPRIGCRQKGYARVLSILRKGFSVYSLGLRFKEADFE